MKRIDVQRAIEVLGKHSNAGDAADELGYNRSALYEAFRRAGLGSPRRYLAGSAETPPPAMPEPEPPHPVDAQIEKEAAARERRHEKAMVEEIRELRTRLAYVDDVSSTSEIKRILPRETSMGVREMTFVALASDWHVEEKVEPEKIAYRNKYDLEIAERRIDRYFQSIIWNVEHHRASGRIAIRDGVLWLGGDLMSGYIHEDLVETNELSPTETMVWLMPKLQSGIDTLVERLGLDRLIIPCSFGNHGRTTEKMRCQTSAENSYEWLAYRLLADRYVGDPCVEFIVDKSEHQYAQVYDWTIHFHHGHDVKYKGGVGGLAIPLMKSVGPWELVRDADLHCIGHFHQLKDFGRAIVNGSLIGYNTYAQKMRCDFEEPQQALFFIDSHRGKCMFTPLWAEDRRPGELVVA